MTGHRIGAAHRALTRRARVVVALVAVSSGLLVTATPAAAADTRIDATIDGRPVAETSEGRPLELWPDRPAVVDVLVRNNSNRSLAIRTVRLEGRVMGLAFFAYDTTVALTVGAGESRRLRFSLDLAGLNGQATGLIPARIALLDAQRHPVASQEFVADVRGSLRSVYGLFGIVVALFTGLSFVGAAIALARHRLSANRWRRAVRFLTPGVGLGLLIVFSLSALRVFVPGPERWLPIVLISSIVLFAVGYLTPTPDEDDDFEDEDEDEGEPDTVDWEREPVAMAQAATPA